MRTIAATLICLAGVLSVLAEDQLYIEDFSIFPGETKLVSIMLDNATEYTALQADITLPDGLNVAMEDGEYIFDLTERKTRTHCLGQPALVRCYPHPCRLAPEVGHLRQQWRAGDV